MLVEIWRLRVWLVKTEKETRNMFWETGERGFLLSKGRELSEILPEDMRKAKLFGCTAKDISKQVIKIQLFCCLFLFLRVKYVRKEINP